MSKSSAIFQRFLKGFIATVIPVVLIELGKGYDFSTSTDLKRFFFSLLTPVVSGLLLAVEKTVSWQDPQTPTPPIPVENQTSNA